MKNFTVSIISAFYGEPSTVDRGRTTLRYIFFALAMSLCACDYLDLVPDNIPTLDHAFANKLEAEKYLYTCYSYMPGTRSDLLGQASAFGSIGLMGADELWTYHPQNGTNNYPALEIAKGNQSLSEPIMNCWEGRNGGQPLYGAIRDCNIFLENVGNPDKVVDLEPLMRQRWIGEVQFLKAYYHFYLFRMYGPIVIADKVHPVTSSTEEFREKRAPVDEVVSYIANLLDTAAANLPAVILNRSTELGRVTRPAALSLKARLLVTAASPLFNGNPDFSNFTDHDGVHLFSAGVDAQKWEAAVAACLAAIEACHAAGAQLYKFNTFAKLSDTTVTQMSIRNSVAERWNPELIWGLSGRAAGDLQKDCMARLDQTFPTNIWGGKDLINPTLNISDLFYTDNGVPIDEDKTWNYSGRYSLRTAAHADRYNLIEGYETVSLQFNRENRYYADLAFDGSVWYMQNNASDENSWTVRAKKGQPQSRIGANNYSSTGLWTKKLVNWKLVITERDATVESFPWPEIRLADLYLLYAEALNEVGRGAEALPWIDVIRERAGLKGVQESWTTSSIQPSKYASQAGLRDIIQRERAIELMFEGHRFWDLRRWKKADEILNQNIFGWNIEEDLAAAYYHRQLLFNQHFVTPRDYFFPLREYELIVNPRLVQNPGW